MTKLPQSRFLWRGCLGAYDKRNFLQFINISQNVQCDNLVQYYLDYSEKIFRSHGKLETVKHLRALYNISLRRSAELSFDAIPFLRTNKKGFPVVLKPFEKFLTGSLDEKRASLTILQLYKLIDVKGKHDISSITDPYTGTVNPEWYQTFLEVVHEEFPYVKSQERVDSIQGTLHISGKNGPNGPAMTTMHADRKANIQNSNWESIKRLALITKNDQLLQIIQASDSVDEIDIKNKKGKIPKSSRLRIKYEPGGKARIFCILDIFSQSALKPIHEFFMKWLRNNPCDGTNDHSIAAKQLIIWTKSPHKLWSFDLTTATDRFPVFLQYDVVKAVFSEEIADLWKDIVVNRDFEVPEGGSTVRFAVGQPLGALSSWAVFSVTHHLLLKTAVRLSGQTTFQDYRIIGDDICIYKDAAVALRYIALIKDLGVPFSIPKSILPHQCNNVNAAELAKRVFVNGNEITPVPPDSVIVYMREPFGKRILIETGIDRGYSHFENPYTVQSLIVKDNEWAALTFPVGKPLPLLKGVKVSFTWWAGPSEDPPGGLNPGWMYWSTRNYILDEQYAFKWILKSFLLKEINSAISTGNRIREDLYNQSWDGSLDANQGGDWKPGLCESTNAMSLIITYMSEAFGKAIYEIQDWVEFETLDLYRILAKMHSFLKPQDLFRKPNYKDEKVKTRVYANRLVREAIRIARKGEQSFLDYINN